MFLLLTDSQCRTCCCSTYRSTPPSVRTTYSRTIREPLFVRQNLPAQIKVGSLCSELRESHSAVLPPFASLSSHLWQPTSEIRTSEEARIRRSIANLVEDRCKLIDQCERSLRSCYARKAFHSKKGLGV
jgi:hypothetical protein